MSKLTKKVSPTSGLSPGTLVHVGEKRIEKPVITVFEYNEKSYEEQTLSSISEMEEHSLDGQVTWVDISGIHAIDVIEDVGKKYDIHPLILEDVINTSQRIKIEEYKDYVYIVVKMIYLKEHTREIIDEQVSILLGKNFVVSFQEGEGDVFDGIRNWIRSGKGRIRSLHSDYLAYALLDAIVDSYFTILEEIGDAIEVLEVELTQRPTSELINTIHSMKKQTMFLRRAIWPLREVIGGMERIGQPLIEDHTLTYLKDVYDHVIQIIETVETFRDLLSGMLDLYLSSMSHRMNEVMKVLTIIATIFIPLTFIAGVYGMNFQYMPGLTCHWGYYIMLGVMLVAGLIMLFLFKKNKWI